MTEADRYRALAMKHREEESARLRRSDYEGAYESMRESVHYEALAADAEIEAEAQQAREDKP